MAKQTLRVKGLREFQRALSKAEKDTRKMVKEELAQAGDVVREDAARRFSVYDARSASRFRVSVRQKGIFVQQSLRKKTGLRPDYGSLQMRRALLPALAENEAEIERNFERAVDRIADRVEG